MIICPKCGGTKVFRFRLDSDWAYGSGDYEPVNEREEYTVEEWNMDSCDRPDIEVFHCRQCHLVWE